MTSATTATIKDSDTPCAWALLITFLESTAIKSTSLTSLFIDGKTSSWPLSKITAESRTNVYRLSPKESWKFNYEKYPDLKNGLEGYIRQNRKQSAIKIILSRPFTFWPAFPILYRMNYSQEWQDKLNLHNGLPQVLDWETAIAKKYVNLENPKMANLIFLNNPVWIEIHTMCGIDPFRKIKAVSKYNVYFDGTYKGLSSFFGLGRLAWMGLYHRRPYARSQLCTWRRK